MSDQVNLDEVRRAALARAERADRNFKALLFAAAVWEMLVLAAFLWAMERGNRLHALLLLATVGSYTIVALGLVALGAYLNRGNLRLLKAVELLDARLVGRK
jgi:hypothetical protein